MRTQRFTDAIFYKYNPENREVMTGVFFQKKVSGRTILNAAEQYGWTFLFQLADLKKRKYSDWTYPQAGTIDTSGMSNIMETALSLDPDDMFVKAARNGDLDAFEGLVERNQKRMLNIAFRITGDYDDACEVTQDAFVSAFRNLAAFRGGARFSTWLAAIVINHARNRLRQVKSRRGREARSLDWPIQTPDGDLKIDPPSSEPSTVDRMEQKDRQKAVQDCIGRLELEFREVLVLRDIQEFSYEEIGGMLRIREGTVKSRLFRAREAVKECLKKVLRDL